jgi:hypothetical protein
MNPLLDAAMHLQDLLDGWGWRFFDSAAAKG